MGRSYRGNPDFPIRFHGNSQFPDTWTDTKEDKVLNILEMMDGHYPKYIPPTGVEIEDVEPSAEESSSKYWGREVKGAAVGNAVMRINNSRKIESTAHELGHDAENLLFDDLGDSKMERYLFKEFFADLNALRFSGAKPDERALTRSTAKDGYGKMFQKASKSVDPFNRSAELLNFEKLINYVENEQYDKLNENMEFTEAPPYLSTENPLDTGSQMLVDSLGNLGELRDLKKDIYDKNRIIQENNYEEIRNLLYSEMEEGRIPESLEQKIDEDSPESFDNLRSFVGLERDFFQEKGVEMVAEILEKDLWDAYLISHDHLVWLEDGVTSEKLFEEMNHIKYGKRFDNYVSLPHEIGGNAAEIQYKKGLRPVEVVCNKDKWKNHLDVKLHSTIKNIYNI